MNSQSQNYPTACAHIHIERFQIEKDGRVFEEQWRCADCGAKFVTLDSLFAGPQEIQVMEPMATLRDEFAIAALNAYISCDKIGVYFWPSEPNRLDVSKEAYKWATAMMEARE